LLYLPAEKVLGEGRCIVQVTQRDTGPWRSQSSEAIAPPCDPEALVREIERIEQSAILARSGPLVAFVARSDEIPACLHEIGRLRELASRTAGKGTGKQLDLDWFDLHYLHFVVWNDARHEIVGSYRCGATDAIVRHYGVTGLSTASRFVYEKLLLARLRRGLELSRSFVRPEYEKSLVPLLLLWRALAEFTARNPRYKFLFGAVSIRSELRPETKGRILDFLRSTAYPALLRLESPPDLAALEREIHDLEGSDRRLPILLRQCVKLGGRLLSFSSDAESNDLDALLVVDLSVAPLEALAAYMGGEGFRAFVRHRRGRHGHGTRLRRPLRRSRSFAAPLC
jgi:putative hemolysin